MFGSRPRRRRERWRGVGQDLYATQRRSRSIAVSTGPRLRYHRLGTSSSLPVRHEERSAEPVADSLDMLLPLIALMTGRMDLALDSDWLPA